MVDVLSIDRLQSYWPKKSTPSADLPPLQLSLLNHCPDHTSRVAIVINEQIKSRTLVVNTILCFRLSFDYEVLNLAIPFSPSFTVHYSFYVCPCHEAIRSPHFLLPMQYVGYTSTTKDCDVISNLCGVRREADSVLLGNKGSSSLELANCLKCRIVDQGDVSIGSHSLVKAKCLQAALEGLTTERSTQGVHKSEQCVWQQFLAGIHKTQMRGKRARLGDSG